MRALAGRAVTPFHKAPAKEALSDEEVIGTVEVHDVAPRGPALPFREESAAAVLSRMPVTAPPSDEESPAGGTSDVRYVDLLRRQHPFEEPFAAPNAPLPAPESAAPAPAPVASPPALPPPVSVPFTASPPVVSQPALATSRAVAAPSAPSISKPLSIEGYAAVSAALVLKRPLAEALEREGVTQETWEESARRWREALAQGRDVKAYDGAFVAALERIRGPFGAIDYAAITVGLERGKAGELGARYQLGPADLMRVQRVGALRAAADPSLAAAVSSAAAAARRG